MKGRKHRERFFVGLGIVAITYPILRFLENKPTYLWLMALFFISYFIGFMVDGKEK